MFDGKAYGEGIVEIVKGYFEREIAPLKAENESLKTRIADLEQRKPEKGEPGKDAEPPTIKAIWDGARPEAEAIIKQAVADAIADLPKPENGKDAANIVEAVKHEGELVLTLQDGRLIKTGIRDGKDGEPGRDGFSLDDFDIERGDDQRTLILRFEGKGVGYEYELTLQHPIYCGVFKEGQEYMPGDMVTWGGSLWHCNETTKDKPDAGPWTLAVKKGRDGKDAKNG